MDAPKETQQHAHLVEAFGVIDEGNEGTGTFADSSNQAHDSHHQSLRSPRRATRSKRTMEDFVRYQQERSVSVVSSRNHRCDHRDCIKEYRKRSDLMRHMVKHNRPFHCTARNCIVRPFSDRAGLLRHTREVHKLDSDGKPTRRYPCPESSCARHRRGFGRHWNMIQHFRRRHNEGNESDGDPVKSSSPELSEDTDIEDHSITATEVPQQSTAVCENLRSKLARLQQERDRVDAEIVAVLKVIEVFERPEP